MSKSVYENITIPSTSAPSWGGYFVFDIKEKNIILNKITLDFLVSSITGLTGSVAGYPNLNPAVFWYTRIEVLVNNNVVNTYYPISQFGRQQHFNTDEDRLKYNTAQGIYNNNTQRALLASTQNHYYVELHCFLNTIKMPILSNSHEIQIRVYMDTLTNQINVSTLTGTPVCNILASNIICKVERLPSIISNNHLTKITRNPILYNFNELKSAFFTVNSGVSTATVILSQLIGKISHLYFVVRPTSTVENNEFLFYPISSFAILDNSSTNIVGGQDVSSSLCLLNYCKDWTLSSYSTEGVITNASSGAYIYLYSFADNPLDVVNNSRNSGYFQFTGMEQLKINFPSQLTSSVFVEVYASAYSILEMSNNNVKKYNL
jgi:hypothetical protein